MLRVLPARQHRLDHLGGGGSLVLRPAHEAFGRPFQRLLVTHGHVGRLRRVAARHIAAGMRGNRPVFVEDFDGPLCGAEGDFLVDQGVGDGVVVLEIFDVIIDVHAAGLQAREFVGRGGQGVQGGLIHGHEKFLARLFEVHHGTLVDLVSQLGNGVVEAGQIEKSLVT